jgi:tetratricopeptide (TPR) repeat protein
VSAVRDGWPAVLLSGFEAAGADMDVAELAVRIGEEVALELGRYRVAHLFHPHADSTPRTDVRFALQGRVRAEGEDMRVTARLVDRATGEHVWGDEYHTAPAAGRWSGSPEDVADVIAARVGGEEGVIVQLLAGERRAPSAPPDTVYDAILRSYEFFLARDATTLAPAVEALQRALDAQPDCGPAWTRLARLYIANHTFEVTRLPTPLEAAITAAHHGVRLDPASRSARCILAAALLTKGELEAGRHELEHALRSSPGSLVYLDVIGYLLTLFGEWERGALLSRTAQMRNPHCLPQVLFGLWVYHLHRGEVAVAYQAALEYRDPTFFWRSVMRASCLGLLGRTSEARAEVADLLARKPDFPVRGRLLLGYYIKFPEVTDRVVDGLARGGLDLI